MNTNPSSPKNASLIRLGCGTAAGIAHSSKPPVMTVGRMLVVGVIVLVERTALIAVGATAFDTGSTALVKGLTMVSVPGSLPANSFPTLLTPSSVNPTCKGSMVRGEAPVDLRRATSEKSLPSPWGRSKS